MALMVQLTLTHLMKRFTPLSALFISNIPRNVCFKDGVLTTKLNADETATHVRMLLIVNTYILKTYQ